MADKYEKQWNDTYLIFKEYVDIFHKLPCYNIEYKNMKLGKWLERQRSVYYADKLAKDRLEKLQAAGVIFNATKKEERKREITALLSSCWKESLCSTDTPIDEILEDPNEIYVCLKKGIYNFKTWIKCCATKRKPIEVLSYYAKILPYLDPNYAYLLCSIKEHDYCIDVEDTKAFFDSFSFASKEDMKQKLDHLLSKVEPKERLVLSMCFGLGLNKTYTYTEIGKELGLSHERIRVIRKNALEKLR